MSDVGEKSQEVAFGKRLQDARKGANLTQQDLCDKADLSYSTLAKIERGAIKAPSVFTVGKIADVIGVSVDSLLGKSGIASSEKKQSKSGIKFVYFDINGCLVRFFHRAFTALADDTGVTLDKVEAVFWHHNDEVCRGETSIEEFNQAIASQLGVKSVDWNKYYLNAVDPIKEMHEIVTWVSQHYSVGLLSNIMPGVVDEMKKTGLIPDIAYSAIVDSSVEHAIKPEKKIYEIAESKAGVDSSEILLVDDSRANVVAAERMGWKVLWFDDYRPSESAKRVKQVLEF